MDVLYEMEDDGEDPGLSAEERLRARDIISKLQGLRGATSANPGRLTVLHNVVGSQISSEQLQQLLQGLWETTTEKKLKVEQVEALSAGAASATFIELNAGVLKLVRENLQITGLAEGAETLHTDAFKFLQAHSGEKLAGNQDVMAVQGARKGRPYIMPDDDSSRRMDRIPYDIVYVAPPQYKGMAARALELLDSSPLVADTGLVIIQIFPKERDEVAAVALSRLVLVDERRYGSTLLMFYEANKEKVSHVDTITEA